MTKKICVRNRMSLCVAWLALLVGGSLQVQASPRVTEEGKSEILWLDRLSDAAVWNPVEECRTRPSRLKCPWGGKAMELYFKVDYHGGEKAYPIGWPRAHCKLLMGERDWHAWDRFEFMIQARTSRKSLPEKPLTLEFGEEGKNYSLYPKIPELDKWIRISVPVAELFKARPALRGGIKRLRFVVSESSYNHDDVLEFHVGGFRLVRSLVCEVTKVTATTPVVYAGQPFVKLDITVIGPPADVKRGVPFTIRSGKRVARREMLPLGRGRQLYDCDISELNLTPGDYQLILFEDDRDRRKSVPLKVVEEPWKQQ